MLLLKTLGGLAIEDDRGPLTGAAARRRSLALLALLATAGRVGMSRDKVLGYLWPDSDTERARNSLKQALFALRRDLPGEIVLADTGMLRLDPNAVRVDLWELEDALARGDVARAAGWYRGPFLDGFHVPGAGEFDQWAEIERVRIARRFANALESAAQRAGSAGDHGAAAAWWRQAAVLDPLNARVALGLMRALAAAGDRTGALEHARVHEALVRSELDAEPDPGIGALVEQLRAELSRQDTEAVAVAPAAVESPADPARPTSPPSPTPSESAAPLRRRPGRAGIAVSIALGVLIAALWWQLTGRRTRADATPETVIVLPFSVSGPPADSFLASGMVHLLSASLEGAGRLRTTHPSSYLGSIAGNDAHHGAEVARRMGADLYVLGDVVRSGARLQISAAVYDLGEENRPMARATVEGDTARLFDLVDRLATRLIAEQYQQPGERLARVAAQTTGSLPALKAYLEGEAAYRDGDAAAAIEAFQRAVAGDSAFALAWYRLSGAADLGGRSELALRAAAEAERHQERLSEHDRRLIQAYRAWRAGDVDEAERRYHAVVTDYPEDVEAWFQLGEVLFHENPLRGRSATEAREAFERVLALEPDHGEALVHLARIAFLEGRSDEVDSLVARASRVAQGPDVIAMRAFRAFALGDRPGEKRVTRALQEDPDIVSSVTALDVAVHADDVTGTERFARALTAARTPAIRGFGYRLLAQTAIARGRWRAAMRELDRAAEIDPVPALELRSLFAVLPFVPLPRQVLDSVRRQVERWSPEPSPVPESLHTTAHAGLHAAVRLHRLGLLSARLEDTTRARSYADSLAGDSLAAAQHGRTLAMSIRAHLAAAADRPADALAVLDEAGWQAVASTFTAEALDRYLRAELLNRLGRQDEALAWYATIAQRAAYELVYLAPSELRRAELYELRGERALAASHYRRFLELWRDCDPELQPLRQEAARRLAGLDTEG